MGVWKAGQQCLTLGGPCAVVARFWSALIFQVV
jgi:hypothetical protein